MSLSFRPRFPNLGWRRLRRAAKVFLPYARGCERVMLAALLCGAGATVLQILKPWPIKVLFDGVLMPRTAPGGSGWLPSVQEIPAGTLVTGVALALLIIAALWGLASYGQAFLTASAGQRVVHTMRRRAYSHLIRLSLLFHQDRSRGDLVMRLTGDINVMRDALVDSMLWGVAEVLLLAAMAAVMLAMDWRLAVVSLALLPLLVFTTFRYSGQIREAARRQRRNEGRVAAIVSESLDGIHVIQAFGREQHQDERFKASSRTSLKAGLKTTRLEASMSRHVELVLAGGVAAVLWYGVRRVLAGALTPGDLLVFVSYVHATYRPVRRLSRIAARLSKAVVCAERVRDVLEQEPGVSDRRRAKEAARLEGRIRFDGVTFAYGAHGPALEDVRLEISPGERVAVVGPSGAGKSTLLALLLRLHDPDSGRILADGIDIRKYRLQSYRDRIAVVLQHALLFGGSIAENIAFGRPEASPEAVEEAARLANAHEFITRLPDGYETRVAESGASLSGGERQRIAIARAFVRDAPILLLDEPLVGLDPSAEAEVTDALERLMRRRTTLVVAHKLASVCGADRIVVLDKGRIVEQGRHLELLRSGGWYAEQWERQGGKEDRVDGALEPLAGGRSS